MATKWEKVPEAVVYISFKSVGNFTILPDSALDP